MREYATTFSQTSCNPLDYPCLRLLTDESVTQLLHAGYACYKRRNTSKPNRFRQALKSLSDTGNFKHAVGCVPTARTRWLGFCRRNNNACVAGATHPTCRLRLLPRGGGLGRGQQAARLVWVEQQQKSFSDGL